MTRENEDFARMVYLAAIVGGGSSRTAFEASNFAADCADLAEKWLHDRELESASLPSIPVNRA